MKTYRFPDLTRRLLLLSHGEDVVEGLEGVVTDEKSNAWHEGFRALEMKENPYNDRGTTALGPNLVALLVCVITVAPLGCARWLGLGWAGGLTAVFAFAGLAVLCAIAPRPRVTGGYTEGGEDR